MTCRTMMSLLTALMCCGLTHGQLLVDFNSTTQDGGPHNDTAGGFSAYNAGHEVIEDFITQSFTAFGTSIGVTPSWPNTTDNRVQQSIDRSGNNDANWTDATTDLGAVPPVLGLDLVTDFIGTDTRTGSGGNGDWDGTTGTPTLFDLSLSGLPAENYSWTSAHIDTENVHGNFAVWISTDGGANFTTLPNGVMTDASPGGNPDSEGTGFMATDSATAAAAGALYTTTFAADGTNDVVLRFAPFSGVAVHQQIWGMNSFVVQQVVPEPGSILLSLMAVCGLIGLVRRRR